MLLHSLCGCRCCGFFGFVSLADTIPSKTGLKLLFGVTLNFLEAHDSEPFFYGRKYLHYLSKSSPVHLTAVINEGYTSICR